MLRFLVLCLFVIGLSVSSVSVCPQRGIATCIAPSSLVQTVSFLLPVQYQTKGPGHWAETTNTKNHKKVRRLARHALVDI
jgi:hypothetical protein